MPYSVIPAQQGCSTEIVKLRMMSAMLVLQACWVLHCFCDVKFKNPRNLEQALLLTRTLLTKDTELPVQVEAAIALQVLLTEQERGNVSFS